MSESKKLRVGILAGVSVTFAFSHFFGVFEPNNFVTGLLWLTVGLGNLDQVKNK